MTRIIRANLSRSLFVISLVLFSCRLFSATPLDINTATAEELSVVMSGVGAKKAADIVAYRDANGAFQSVDHLINVKGIGSALLERNKMLIRAVNESEEPSVLFTDSES